MKQQQIALALLVAVGAAGCSKEVTEEQAIEASATLQVRTRALDDDATVSYPVSVYVFQDEECKGMQTISAANQSLNMALTEGTYQVYAIGGAGSTDYELPAREDATTATAIALKEGRQLTDLMAARSTLTLTDGGTNTLTLGMERKAMLVQSVTVNRIPTSATAVSVSIAPLWQSLTVGAAYTGTTGTSTIALTKQDDGRTWQSTEAHYMLPPSSQPATITVSITQDGTIHSYAYNTQDELEAGYKINIEGTYTDAVGVTLTGTMTGATWKGERTIRFDFDESGSTGSTTEEPAQQSGTAVTGDIPAVNTLYKGCFVLSVNQVGNDAEVVLVSPKEMRVGKSRSAIGDRDADVEAYINGIIAETGTDDISGWRLPTLEELNQLKAVQKKANSKFGTGSNINNDNFYLCTLDDVIIFHKLAIEEGSTSQTAFTGNELIRPFVTIHISKGQ